MRKQVGIGVLQSDASLGIPVLEGVIVLRGD